MMMRRQKAHQRQTPDRPGEVGCGGDESEMPKRWTFGRERALGLGG